jgi:hypothetical protein
MSVSFDPMSQLPVQALSEIQPSTNADSDKPSSTEADAQREKEINEALRDSAKAAVAMESFWQGQTTRSFMRVAVVKRSIAKAKARRKEDDDDEGEGEE